MTATKTTASSGAAANRPREPKRSTKNVLDFRAAHDKSYIVPQKIENGIKSLAKEGPEAWDYEVDFLKRTGLSTTDLAMYRDAFEDYIVIVSAMHQRSTKRIWCASKQLAAKLRELSGRT